MERQREGQDDFACTVAHELKSGLAALIWYADVLQAGWTTMPGEEVQQCMRAIAWNGHKMNDVVDAILLLNGLDRTEVAMAPLDMAFIVTEAQQRLAYIIEQYHAEIELPVTWPVAVGYGPWVEEVWVNYLSNGLKYGGQPPRLQLGGRPCAEGMVCFWVRDNGRGLTPQDRAALLAPSAPWPGVPAHGHGLGLYIARRIVERLGGRVAVRSRLGQGSTFAFALPSLTAQVRCRAVGES